METLVTLWNDLFIEPVLQWLCVDAALVRSRSLGLERVIDDKISYRLRCRLSRSALVVSRHRDRTVWNVSALLGGINGLNLRWGQN